jgi:serine/threonine-protein kinase
VDDGAALVASLPQGFTPTQDKDAIVDGRYVVRGLLGQGGMGRVYLAEDTQTRESVAIKILRREHTTNRFLRERFLRDVEVAAQLGHPNIVRIFDAGELPDGAPFMVLELLSGETLYDRVARDGPLIKSAALRLVKEVAGALGAAHAAGVVHRDIKPENLFLPRAGGIKVVDFGLAKLKEGSVTAAGIALGTVPYMAPEQALADPIDGRTDVYALGGTLFRIVAGRLAFNFQDDAQVIAHHLYVPAPAPSSIRPGIDPRVDAIVAACLRKRPANRYASMAALIDDIDRALGGEPVAPPPLVEQPDVYEPLNPMSRTAARLLRGMVPA